MRRAARGAAAGVPRLPVLLPDRRHRQPGAEFRPVRADRRADRGRRTSTRSRTSRSACSDAIADDSRRRRRPHHAGARTTRRCSVDVDRLRAAQAGRDRSATWRNNLLISLSSTVAGGAVLLPESGQQRELHRGGADRRPDSIDSVQQSARHAASALPGSASLLQPDAVERRCRRCRRRLSQTLADIATVIPARQPRSEISHYTVQRVIDVDANRRRPRSRLRRQRHPEGRSRALGPLPAGMQDHIRGQNEVMEQSFRSLLLGLILAIAPGLPAAGGAVPVLGRSVHHHDGGARRAGRHPLDAGADRHHHQRRVADGRDHGGRHRRSRTRSCW